jgi:hypothetical protein
MFEAYDAATAGSPARRAAARNLWPTVVAVEHLAYRTIAAFWAAERSDEGAAIDSVDGIVAEVADLRRAVQER